MGVLKDQKGKLKQLKKKIYKYLDQENLTTFEKQVGQVNMLPKLINKVTDQLRDGKQIHS